MSVVHDKIGVEVLRCNLINAAGAIGGVREDEQAHSSPLHPPLQRLGEGPGVLGQHVRELESNRGDGIGEDEGGDLGYFITSLQLLQRQRQHRTILLLDGNRPLYDALPVA